MEEEADLTVEIADRRPDVDVARPILEKRLELGTRFDIYTDQPRS